MKTTHELVAKRFADIEQDVTSTTIVAVSARVFELKKLYKIATREWIIEILVPDYRKNPTFKKGGDTENAIWSKIVRRFSLIGHKAFDGEVEGACESVMYLSELYDGDIDSIIEDMYPKQEPVRW